MIPKIIHYCWFGGKEKPLSVKKYINTWKSQMPDYEIYEWNERNFNIDSACIYVRQAYKHKKWAFVSDYVRLKALYEYGGIYLDTDVEILKDFNDFLKFDLVFGFETNDRILTAMIMSKQKSSFIKDFMNYYQNNSFINEDGTLKTNETNVIILTKMLLDKGLKLNGKKQILDEIMVFPQTFFCPNNIINIFGKYKNDNYMFHHADGSWINNRKLSGITQRSKRYLVGILRNIFGTDKISNSMIRKIAFHKDE